MPDIETAANTLDVTIMCATELQTLFIGVVVYVLILSDVYPWDRYFHVADGEYNKKFTHMDFADSGCDNYSLGCYLPVLSVNTQGDK